jgi:hypothetical protein
LNNSCLGVTLTVPCAAFGNSPDTISPAWALTGGVAIEIHGLRLGCDAGIRALNDLDFIADSFAGIPDTLSGDFLFRHIHPSDPPGKTMLQAIDADTALRIDVFRAYGATMKRTSLLDFPGGPIQLVSPEDLVARTARLALDLAEGAFVPTKHAVDFTRLVVLVDSSKVENIWPDHRRPQHPASFAETVRILRNLIPARQDLLITPDYSKDATEICGRCAQTAAFRLADPNVVLSLLEYC